MKTCPICGEINGVSTGICVKCGNFFPRPPERNKICPTCRKLYGLKIDECPECFVPTAMYDPYEPFATPVSDNGEKAFWAFLLGGVSLLFGNIYTGTRLFRTGMKAADGDEKPRYGVQIIIITIFFAIFIPLMLAIFR